MIYIEDIPKSGLLIITVYFQGYKDYFQNESRRALLNVPEIDKKNNLGIDLKPLQFCLIKMMEEGVKKEKVGRARGAQYLYSYSNMTPDKFKTFYRNLKKWFEGKSMWNDFEIMIANPIGGLE